MASAWQLPIRRLVCVTYFREGPEGRQRELIGEHVPTELLALAAEFREESTLAQDGKYPSLDMALDACLKYGASLLVATRGVIPHDHFVPRTSRQRLTVRVFVADQRDLVIYSFLRWKLRIEAKRAGYGRAGNPRAKEALVLARAARHPYPRRLPVAVEQLIVSLHRQGVGLRGIARELNERSILTPAGRGWQPQTVKYRLNQILFEPDRT